MPTQVLVPTRSKCIKVRGRLFKITIALTIMMMTSSTSHAKKILTDQWRQRRMSSMSTAFVTPHHQTRTPLHKTIQSTITNNYYPPKGSMYFHSNKNKISLASSSLKSIPTTTTTTPSNTGISVQKDQPQPPLKVNLLTIHQDELETLLTSWNNHPKYRAKQILHWVNECGVTDFDDMVNIPKKLRNDLKNYATVGSLDLEVEMVSKDGTRKRAYRLWDGQLIESVLMPYEDGRNTACISSQAGCAMGCVFCATGQMGFARQLTSDEIYEQVARFASELKQQNKRLSNVVMMGMGEPLANYRNVIQAIRRMNTDLGIGARKITVSTVGVVPNIRKLMEEDIQVRLAVSLHCSNEEERTALLPANKRYGGLDELMMTIKEYIDTNNRRVTFEWALIEGQNDTPEVARQLGKLLERFGIRKDMAHINLIPLNPTGGYAGSPSGRMRVNDFVKVLDDEFGIKATPRVRRGIDIEAGCGQLKAAVKKKEEKEAAAANASKLVVESEISSKESSELKSFMDSSTQTDALLSNPIVGVYEDEDDEDENDEIEIKNKDLSLDELYQEKVRQSNSLEHGSVVEFAFHQNTVDLDDEDDFFEDEDYENELDKKEAARLIDLVKLSFPTPPQTTENQTPTSPSAAAKPKHDPDKILQGPTTSITDDESIRKAKRKRKKLLKNIKAITKLKDMERGGKALNQEQLEKIGKEEMWQLELESIEHNLK